MRKLALVPAAAAALSLAAPATAATTIFSENFESGLGVFTTSGQVGINTGQAYADCCGAFGSAAALANHFVAFGSGGLPAGTLSTTFNTVAGVEYTLTFERAALGAPADNLGSDSSLQFDFDGGIGGLVAVTDVNNNLDSGFLTTHFNFIATGSTTTLSITSFDEAVFDRNLDQILDNISVTVAEVAAVPEPASWAMMLVGFAGMGLAMRRRRSAAMEAL